MPHILKWCNLTTLNPITWPPKIKDPLICEKKFWENFVECGGYIIFVIWEGIAYTDQRNSLRSFSDPPTPLFIFIN
jgi:hypothetical protein